MVKVNEIFSNFFFSGHCCIQNVIITIIDKNEFFDQCNLIVSEHPLTVVQYPTTAVVETTTVEQTTTYVTSIEKQTFKEVNFFLKYLFHILLRYILNYSVKSNKHSPDLVAFAYMVICVLVLL